MPYPNLQNTCGVIWGTPMNPLAAYGGFKAGPVFCGQDEKRIAHKSIEWLYKKLGIHFICFCTHSYGLTKGILNVDCNKGIPLWRMSCFQLHYPGFDFCLIGLFTLSSPFQLFPLTEHVLCTCCQLNARLINVKNPGNPFPHKEIISRYIAGADLSSVTAPGHCRFGLSLVCLRCSWPSLSSLPSHCLQATGSEATCHFGSMDTPAHPPVHSLVTQRHKRGKKRARERRLILGGWWPDSEWIDGFE